MLYFILKRKEKYDAAHKNETKQTDLGETTHM